MNKTGKRFRKTLSHRIFGVVHPKALSGQWQALRQIDIEARPDPLEPIMSVTPQALSIRDNSHTFRDVFLLPMMLAFWVLSVMWWQEKADDWPKAERAMIRYIVASKRMFGEDFFIITDNPTAIEMYNYIGDDGQMSFQEYIDYCLTGTVTGLGGIIQDILFSLLIFGGAIGLTLWTVLFHRRAEIYFDRQRRIVYSWRFGLILASRFDDLGVIEDLRGLQLVLCGENAQDDHGWRRILIQPTTQPMFNRVEDNKYPLAVILRFMDKGMDAVVKDGPFRRPSSPSLFVDKQPKNFDQRLDALVQHLNETNGHLSDEVIESLNSSRG